MRVLLTGMGGELGTRVANLLEAMGSVDRIVGMDLDPPRRRITRAEFHRIDPREHRKAVELVREVDPEVVVHFGVYEPNARSSPAAARIGTAASAVSVLGAAAKSPSLRHIIVRSGIEVYGRARGSADRPDESAPVAPTSPFGHSLAHVETVAVEAGRLAGVPVTCLRYAPVVGPSFPSPLGRYLRLPVVPVSACGSRPFSLLHQEDAAAAVVAALGARYDGPINVAGPGTVTAVGAARLGRRWPLPIVGPVWLVARAAAEMLSAPVPPHLVELLTRGRTADGARAVEVLGLCDPAGTADVVRQLYQWGTVTVQRPYEQPAG